MLIDGLQLATFWSNGLKADMTIDIIMYLNKCDLNNEQNSAIFSRMKVYAYNIEKYGCTSLLFFFLHSICISNQKLSLLGPNNRSH